MKMLRTTLPLMLLAGAGVLLAQSVKAARLASATRTAERSRLENHRAAGPIRPAGPESMRTPPNRWDIVDEQSDKSFSASDPPGDY